MSFDGIVTRAITNELNQSIKNGRITKIYQPYENELLFHIRKQRQNHKVLISAHPTYARIHLTKEQYENPTEPPMFCMLLRKHLEGSVIERIEQVDLERMILIEFQSKNEIGDLSYKQLIIEIMGRHSNIILVDKEKNTILDSIKHLSPAVNRYRTVMPGQKYIAPPTQGKISPLHLNKEDFLKKIDFNAGKIDRQMVNQFMGISPLFAKEVLERSGLPNEKTLPEAFLSLIKKVKAHQYEPQMIVTKHKEFFYVLPLTHLEGKVTTFSSISELLDRFYYGKAERDRVKQQANDLERFIRNERDKNKKKIKKLEKTLQKAEKADQYQLMGELLTAHLYMVNQGDQKVEVTNYYDKNGSTVTIQLDPQKSPSENAQAYFQKYQKLKNSITIVQDQIKKANEEIIYLDSLLQQIEVAAPKDITEIREELAEEGYLKRKNKQTNKKMKKQKPLLETYQSSDGTEILVGKNNKQNEYLTNKLAKKEEIWLHTKDIPGSHVVIRNPNPSKQTLLEAANIAAYFSRAKSSSQVPVDYTKIKHVKKPKGSKPGFVIYDQQTTLFVTPDEDLIYKLRK